jgi:hypothetical protein
MLLSSLYKLLQTASVCLLNRSPQGFIIFLLTRCPDVHDKTRSKSSKEPPELIVLDDFESERFQKHKPFFFYHRLASAFKSPVYTLGRFKHMFKRPKLNKQACPT